MGAAILSVKHICHLSTFSIGTWTSAKKIGINSFHFPEKNSVNRDNSTRTFGGAPGSLHQHQRATIARTHELGYW